MAEQHEQGEELVELGSNEMFCPSCGYPCDVDEMEPLFEGSETLVCLECQDENDCAAAVLGC